jgi:hypothetical protein
MNARVSLTARKLKWLAPLLASVLLSGAANAADRFLIPQDMNLPFYARGLGHTDDGTWVVTAFYRPLEWVPDKFNLLAMFDFNMDPNCPLLVEGFAVLEAGTFAAIQEKLQNVPGVLMPICFAESPEVLKAMANGKLTFQELMGMKSLLIGWADFYNETLQPPTPSDPLGKSVMNVVASGFLEDGRSFYVHSEVIYMHGEFKDATYNVTVRFGD